MSGRTDNAASPSGHTTSQWLIERGQPEGEQNAVWLEHTGIHPATEGRWTSNAWDAAMFPDKATAEAYIAERGLEARAVEHGFMHEPTREETLHYWLARLTSTPRWVSIGSIDSHAELHRVSREDYEKIQAVLRGE